MHYAKPSAEKSYSPFEGYVQPGGAAASGRGGGGPGQSYLGGRGGRDGGGRGDLGASLKAPDWSQQKLVPGKWVMFDAAKAGARTTTAPPAEEEGPTPKLGSSSKGLSVEESAKWRAEHEISIIGDQSGTAASGTGVCPVPLTSYAQCKKLMPAGILAAFERQGFTAPTPIQAQAWSILFEHRDMVGIAKTGSGKTLAFMVPAITHVVAQDPLRPGDGPICVVLAPTRELAQQIEVESKKVMPTTLRIVCLYGGCPKGPQLYALSGGAHIVVATPGRLIDFLETRRTNLLRVTYLVLDEADRMLDMGFEPQVRAICSQIRVDRQTLMFSATWPVEIQRLAATFLRQFIRIHVGSMELLANADVTQTFVFTSEAGKFAELRKLLAANTGKRTLLFVKMKRTADDLERQLRGMGFTAFAIHGDKEQAQREYLLQKLRTDTNMILVATDVAARGLDVKHLDVVINFDFPMQIDDYVHRIGRTGRAGAKGSSYTLITKREDQVTGAVITKLISIVEKAGQIVPPELANWKEELTYRPPGRGSNQRHGFVSYKHDSRPSFMATPPQPAAGTAIFGVPVGGKPAAAAPARGNLTAGNVTRFADSDDDEPAPPKAAKRPRDEDDDGNDRPVRKSRKDE